MIRGFRNEVGCWSGFRNEKLVDRGFSRGTLLQAGRLWLDWTVVAFSEFARNVPDVEFGCLEEREAGKRDFGREIRRSLGLSMRFGWFGDGGFPDRGGF